MATTLNSSYSADLNLTAGTYYLSANCDLTVHNLTIDLTGGDVILKRNGNVYFTNVAGINTTASGSNKFYFTVKNDDTIGDTISGSTGSPSVAGGTINGTSGTAITGAVVLDHWEVRWANVGPLIYSTNTGSGCKYKYITWKNCAYATVHATYNWVIYHTGVYNTAVEINNLVFDNTNTLTSSGGLVSVTASNNVEPYNIIVVCNTTSTGVVTIPSVASKVYYNIKVTNAGTGSGLYIGMTGVTCTLKDSNTSINTGGSNLGITLYVRNCLFDQANVNYNIKSSTWSPNVYLYNCTFAPTVNAAVYLMTRYPNFYAYNCIFANKGPILYSDSASGPIGNFFFYNCCFPWRQGNNYLPSIVPNQGVGNAFHYNINPIWADPMFVPAASLTALTIDSTFDDYIPDGYFVANLPDYEYLGGDTFTTLSVDPTLYTNTGFQYGSSDRVTPGMMYKVSAFTSITGIIANFTEFPSQSYRLQLDKVV